MVKVASLMLGFTVCTLLLGRIHDPVYRKMIDEGHLDHYRHEIVSLQHHRTQLEHHL